MTGNVPEMDETQTSEEEQPEGGYPAIEDFEEEERARAEEEARPQFTLEGLNKAICKQPLHRHIYRQLLVFLEEEHSTEEAEAFLEEVPEFTYAIQPAGRVLDVLERAGGIERLPEEEEDVDEIDFSAEEDELDAETDDLELDEFDAEQLEEEEVEEGPQDALATLVGAHWIITDLGVEYVEATDPIQPLITLITQDPSRTSGYLLVLEMCAEGPKSLADLERALKQLQEEDESAAQIKPSVFLDRLERVGGLYWKSQWNATKEGKQVLADLKAEMPQ